MSILVKRNNQWVTIASSAIELSTSFSIENGVQVNRTLISIYTGFSFLIFIVGNNQYSINETIEIGSGFITTTTYKGIGTYLEVRRSSDTILDLNPQINGYVHAILGR